MNVQLPVHMDKSSFLAWVQGREGRYELAEGRVVMMVNAIRAHGMILSNLLVLLCSQLDARQWTVLPEFGLDLGPKTLRFPDLVVDRAGGAAGDHVATSPTLLIEVLSPSTARFDLGDKVTEFLRLPTLAAYLVFAQDERKAWIWVRRTEGFQPGPEVIEGETASIQIAALNLRLPFADVYARIKID
jgi:Uma2 family endonuclease